MIRPCPACNWRPGDPSSHQAATTIPKASRIVLQMKKGYMYLNEAPGIGVDIDEKLAAKYPFKPFPAGTGFRFPIRKADGTQIRP